MSGPWITRTLGDYPPDMFEVKAETPEEAAAAAENLIKAGVDIVKLYPLTPDQYKAVMAVARKHGKRGTRPYQQSADDARRDAGRGRRAHARRARGRPTTTS